MRMMMKVSIPVTEGNTGVKEGILPKTVMNFIDHFNPEASYFVAEGGQRTAYFFFNAKDVSDIPSFAEPFFMNLNARIELTPAMNVHDMQTGIEKAMKPK